MKRSDLEALAVAFTEAFNRDDLDGVMSYFAEDAVYDEFDGARHRGKAAIRAAFEPQFRGAYGRLRFHQEDLFADEAAGKAMISWLLTLEKADKAGGWRGLDLLRIEDGRIVEKQTYAKARAPLIEKPAESPRVRRALESL